MKIEVDVLRAEQSWDLDTKERQNYLVIEVFGIETRVPCSEQELVQALTEAAMADEPTEEAEHEQMVQAFNQPRAAPPTFVNQQEPEPEPDPMTAQAPQPAKNRKLAPMKREQGSRPRGDDAGIAQG